MGGALKRLVWGAANRLFRAIDALYRRRHRLEPVDRLLHVGREVYRGPPRRLADGTLVAPGDPIGTMHFDNQLLARESGAAGSAGASGFRFARRFFPAFRALAARAAEDPAWGDLVAFRGVGWLPPHGEKYGFEYQPLPPGLRTRWLRWYLGWLIWAFNPAAARRERGRLQPREVWLSRRRLVDSFVERPE